MSYPDDSCDSCVGYPDCFYCAYPGTSFGTCVCADAFSFFDEPSCGYDENALHSRFDCQFSSENGESIAAFIGIFSFVAVVVLLCCIVRSGVCWSEAVLPHSKATRGPAYTTETAIPSAVAVPEGEGPHLQAALPVCAVLCTDVVRLTPSAPREESAIFAESEIVVVPTIDV